MISYTVILLYKWNIHNEDIKKIIHTNKLKWNSKKIKKLTNEELKNEYIKYKVIDYIKINDNTVGSSGIYENLDSSIMIKFIKIINNDHDNDHNDNDNNDHNCYDNMLIIYKGEEKKAYKELIIKCKNIGCLVIKIIDNVIIFKDRINIELINSIRNENNEKNVKIRNFIEKIKINKENIFSDNFKNKWIDCIKNDNM